MRNPTFVYALYVTGEGKVQQLRRAVSCTVAVIYGVISIVLYGPTKSLKKWMGRFRMFLMLLLEVVALVANIAMPKEQQ